MNQTIIYVLYGVAAAGLVALVATIIPWRNLALHWVGHKADKAHLLLEFGGEVDQATAKYIGDIDGSLLEEYFLLLNGVKPEEKLVEQNKTEVGQKVVYKLWTIYEYKFNKRKRYLFVPQEYGWRVLKSNGKRLIETVAGEIMPIGVGAGIPDELLSEIAEAVKEKAMLNNIRSPGVKLDWMKIALIGVIAIAIAWLVIGGNFNKPKKTNEGTGQGSTVTVTTENRTVEGTQPTIEIK